MSDRKDVAIIMGSDSDWPVMEEAAKALDSFGISYSADVVSAHRMPEEMVEFAKRAGDADIAKKIESQLATLSEEAKAKGAQLSARRNTKTGF